MAEFVTELKELTLNGIEINGKQTSIIVDGFIMDAPATASILYVNPFNSYDGCRKCSVYGKFLTKVVFLDMDAPLRTDYSFRQRSCPNHHTGTSLLETVSSLVHVIITRTNTPAK